MFRRLFFFLMIRRPPRSTLDRSSAASDVYKRQSQRGALAGDIDHVGMAAVQQEMAVVEDFDDVGQPCLLYTSPSPRDRTRSRMPSSA